MLGLVPIVSRGDKALGLEVDCPHSKGDARTGTSSSDKALLGQALRSEALLDI